MSVPVNGMSSDRAAVEPVKASETRIGTDYDAAQVALLSDTQVAQILEKRFAERSRRYYPTFAGGAAGVRVVPWGGQETARTFRVELKGRTLAEKKVLFVKLCPIFERINPSRLEYETLQLLYERMPGCEARCRVSRPLDFFPELNAYAMESVGTRNLRRFLLKENSRFRSTESLGRLRGAIGDCGKWLATFHSLTISPVRRRFSTKSLIEGINQDYCYESLRRYPFSTAFFRELDALMARLAGLDGTHDMPCAKWHWDYTPGHVYLDGDCVSVIDITGIDDTPIYEDIGRFLSELSVINTFPRYPQYDRRRADGELNEHFTRMYAFKLGLGGEPVELFAGIYKIKYLVIWFFSQHARVASKIHPLVAGAFARLRLVPLFERVIRRNIERVNAALDVRGR